MPISCRAPPDLLCRQCTQVMWPQEVTAHLALQSRQFCTAFFTFSSYHPDQQTALPRRMSSNSLLQAPSC